MWNILVEGFSEDPFFLSFFHTGYHCSQWPRLGSVSDHGLVGVVILQEVNIWVLLPCILVMPLPSRARNAYVTTYCRQLSDHKLSKLVFVVVPSRQVSGKLFPSQRLSELIYAKAAESIFPALARPSLRAVSLMSPVYIWAPTEGFVGPLVHLRGFELARPSPFSPAPGG